MTAQKTRRKAATWLASATAALVVLSGLAIAPTAALAAEPGQGVTVTAVNGAAPHAKWPNVAINAGSTLTVTGALPANLSDPASETVLSGVYLQWCLKPAADARPATGTCDGSKQQWIASGATTGATVAGSVADKVWSFTREMTPSASIAGNVCGAEGAAECGIYIRPDHRFGTAVTAYDQFIPLRFASNLGEADSITAAVVPSAVDKINKIKLEVSATGIDFENNPLNTDTGSKNSGAYFAVVEKGTYLTTPINEMVANNFAYVPNTATTHSAASTLEFDLKKLDLSKEYEVVSWRAHGNPSAERFLGATAFDLQTELTAIQRQRIAATYAAEVAVADNTGLKINAEFTGATGIAIPVGQGAPGPSAGLYAALIEAGTIGELSMENQGVAAGFAPNVTITNGAGSTTLTALRADLDRTKNYEVAFWYAHANPTSDTILGSVPLTVSDTQWDSVFTDQAADTSTSVKLKYATVKYNVANTATVTVSSGTGTPAGKATVTVAGKSYTASLSEGKAVLNLGTLTKVGSYTAAVKFVSSDPSFADSNTTATLKITKATPRVSAKLASSKVKTNKNAKLSVAVTIPGTLKAKAANYSVAVFDGKKKIKTARLNSAGKVNIKLPKLKAGTHKIKVSVVATANTNLVYSSTRSLRAVRP